MLRKVTISFVLGLTLCLANCFAQTPAPPNSLSDVDAIVEADSDRKRVTLPV